MSLRSLCPLRLWDLLYAVYIGGREIRCGVQGFVQERLDFCWCHRDEPNLRGKQSRGWPAALYFSALGVASVSLSAAMGGSFFVYDILADS